ncbi:MAG TPA: baseplate J/gp47 family protein, partial [Dehalococcoidia bacterium]|nr:baseplate J/gp47 family protein [Dehalococcoidia bacterium]
EALSQGAGLTLQQSPVAALPAITLLEHPPEQSLGDTTEEDGSRLRVWTPQRDLMLSSRFAREFKVEVGDDGSANLIFGDGNLGKRPAAGTSFTARYRTDNGTPGNVGHETITHIVSNDDGIIGVRNPLPALSGTALESIEEARMYAPQAFYTEERCVTQDDYVAMAERHSEVQKAAAVVRWTGSWHTVYILVDRYEGRPVDEEFRRALGSYLDRYRMAGYDLDIRPPYFVPLDIALTVFVESGYFRTAVRQILIEVFSNVTLPDGQRGFFHLDNFTFGQYVYQSQVVTRAAQVPGVTRVDVTRFARWGGPSGDTDASEDIEVRPFEVARLDNDLSAPWNGTIRFNVAGGW